MNERARLVHDMLDRAAAQRSGAIAVRDETGAWTYGELVEQSRRISAWLQGRGVGAGDRVLAAVPNSRQLVALVYGVSRLGAVLVPVGADVRPYQLHAIVDDAAPALIVQEVETAEQFQGQVVDLGTLRRELVAHNPTGDIEGPDPSDTALLIYTSGSTSSPRGVKARHQQISFVTAAIDERLAYRADDVVYTRSPFSFDYGLYQAFLCAFATCELALTGRQPEIATLRFIWSYNATVLPIVPPLAHTLVLVAARTREPATIRMITSTGAPLHPRLAAELRSVFPGATVVAMYGMTECKRISIAQPDADITRPGTVGTALPGTVVEILDQTGSRLPAGNTGQIVVRGPHVMDGYWRDPLNTAHRFGVDPVTGQRTLMTGDFGFLDKEGNLTVVGRRDEIFKRHAVRISTTEVELAALDINGVQEVAAIPPLPSGEFLIWVRGTPTAYEVLAGIAERLGPAKTPDRCIHVKELPRSSAGKIDKRRLLREFVEQAQ